MHTVPVVPPIDAGLLERHTAARVAATEAVEALDGPGARAFRWYQVERLVEALANVFFDDRELVVPPHRRHLGPKREARVVGARAALRHVDVRLAMFSRGHLEHVVGHETPYVVNGMAEVGDPSGIETNAGLPRLTDTGFDPTQTAFVPPGGAHCAELVEGIVDVSRVTEIPPIVRAGWACASLLAVHPFVDGNGRTARFVFHLLSSSDPAHGVDWATVERWAMHRAAYVEALKFSQQPSSPRYDGRLVDTRPFVEFAIHTAIEGADVIGERAGWFARTAEVLASSLGDTGSTDAAVLLELAVHAAGSASLDELSALVDDPLCTQLIAGAVATGRLEWDRRGLLRPAVARSEQANAPTAR